jgi:formylglycine-generating enzyme required for sulfatase activity
MMIPAAVGLLVVGVASANTPERIVTPSGYPMRRIPAGTFTMGCTPEQEPDCEEDEKPAHTVNITFPFFMGEVEVTRGVYRDVAGGAPEAWSCTSNDCPVAMVSWNNAVALANEMSIKEGLKPCYTIQGENVSWPDGLLCEGYRLPTEAEWEYAARAGTGFKYAGSNDPDQVAWYESNSRGDVHRVGRKAPNAWGLYDMSGNVFEWVWGGYRVYSKGRATNPVGTLTEDRVLRGGSWYFSAHFARVADRLVDLPGYRNDDIGLRLVRTDPSHIASLKAADEARRVEEELARQVILSEDAEVPADQEDTEHGFFRYYYWICAAFAIFPAYWFLPEKTKKNSPVTGLVLYLCGLASAWLWMPIWIFWKSKDGHEEP